MGILRRGCACGIRSQQAGALRERQINRMLHAVALRDLQINRMLHAAALAHRQINRMLHAVALRELQIDRMLHAVNYNTKSTFPTVFSNDFQGVGTPISL